MKNYFLLISICFISFLLRAQIGIDSSTQWRFIKGDSIVPSNTPIYGIQGFGSQGNKPKARCGSTSWIDGSGNLWLFGGFTGLETFVNDLWKFDPATNQWTFMKGDNIDNAPGVYGIMGIAADANKPGARFNSISWIDGSGNLWLFGGYGKYSSSSNLVGGLLNDLWKYNPSTNQWTWIKGDNAINVRSIHGILSTSSPINDPGGRESSVSWLDNSGNFWLFGGDCISTRTDTLYGERNSHNRNQENFPSERGPINDLWKYSPATNEWTWMKGDTSILRPGIYGVQGVSAVANNPGAREGSVSWTDVSGNFWLFGGFGYNDLWKYNPNSNQWTWMKGDSISNQLGIYGVQGVSAVANNPGARYGGVSWTDVSGNFWLFGGYGYNVNSYEALNDLWRYDPATNNWTWMKGDSTFNVSGIYGEQGIGSPVNKPGPKSNAVSWKNNSNIFWLFGGIVYINGYINFSNDLWKYNTNNNEWTWMKGDSTFNVSGIYGEQGYVSEGNTPGARKGSVSWKDGSGNMWVFGGNGFSTSGDAVLKNDLWKYDPLIDQWKWMKGDSLYHATNIYGIKGVEGPTNNPGAREGSLSWTDASGKLWLFGGYGYDVNSYVALNDLWRYDPATNNWTWIKGDKDTIGNGGISGHFGVYGNIGTPDITSNPGARYRSMTWTDATGNLWLFGGDGFAHSNSGFLNDLWKYDISTNQWTWIKGDSSANVLGTYGVQGAPAIANKPGARYGAVYWADNSGNLWLFGGNGFSNSTADNLNDLWKYNIQTNQWTWIKGDNVGGATGIYGVQGIEASANKPGARNSCTSWKDGSGNLWLFGGDGSGAGGMQSTLNDLWKYNPATNQWTWMKGASVTNNTGTFGTRLIGAPANTPGATWGAVSASDASGNFWLFGGTGNTANGASIPLNTLMRYSVTTNQWTWVKGAISSSSQGIYGVMGTEAPTNKPGARSGAVSWADTAQNLWLFGGKDFSDYLSDLWKFNPVTNQWAWVKGDNIKNVLTGTYGTLGTAATTNKPGAREKSVSWTDSMGKLWLFGGSYLDAGTPKKCNDLWKFDPVINQWTWIKGDNTPDISGIYGSQGISSLANKPGAREAGVTWKDGSGNLWLFGGAGFSSGGITGQLNDLWKYNPTSNQWVWVKGDNTINALGVYGVQGTASATNKPGARSGAVPWIDSSGKLWLFGGNGFDESGTYGKLNDLWKYDPVTNQWSWMKGDNTAGGLGVYGSLGIASVTNKPGAREGSVSWTDIYGKLWLLGGNGNNASSSGNLNDLWKYDINTNKWTWVKGDNMLNANGKSNRPGSRTNSISWADGYGDLWLFGGFGNGTSGIGYLNDLWKIYGGTKYIFVGTGDWNIAINWINGLIAPTTIKSGMDVTIYHDVTRGGIPGNCVNHGPITLEHLGRLTVESGKILTIDQGGFSNAGYVIGPGNLPGRILFTGTSLDSLNCSGSISTPIVLSNKNMYLTGNTTTSSIDLTGNILSSIKLGSYDLNMGTASLIASSTNFIITEGTGKLVRHAVGNEPVIFHVGADANSYTPVTITTTTGTPDSFSVRVITGVTSAGATPGPVTSGNVNRTWLIEKATAGAGTATITFQWNLNEEQSGFNRTVSYISHKLVCPPPDPPSCYSSYYDAFPVSSAAGTNPYTQTRTGVTNFNNSPSFIVTSSDVVYTFINVNSIGPGDGNWSNPNNWTNFQVPPNTITPGMDIVIDPTIGNECIFTGTLIVQPGGKLTVKPGKKLTIRPF